MSRYAYVELIADGQRAPPDLPLLPSPAMLQQMEAALLGLPRLTREIFLAHRLDDLGYGEIARLTGLSTSGVERHMVRAIVALDRELSREDDG